MLKRIFFAVAPLMLIAGTVTANDDLLSAVAKLDADKSNVAQADEMDNLGEADVEALLGEGEEDSEEAIAACFRRIRYGYGYRSYGYRSCYSFRCYSPVYYNYPCYTNYCYRPVYRSCYTPIYSNYWGCW